MSRFDDWVDDPPSQEIADLYEEQDRIDDQRADLIDGIERQLRTTHEVQRLFTVRWTIR